MPVAVPAHALGIDVNDPLELGAPVGDGKRLVNLLLVLGHEEARPGVREQVLRLGRWARRIYAERRRAYTDGAELGEEPLRPILRLDGHAIARLEPERNQAEAERAHPFVVVSPGVLAPEAKPLLAERDAIRAVAATSAERGRERFPRRRVAPGRRDERLEHRGH